MKTWKLAGLSTLGVLAVAAVAAGTWLRSQRTVVRVERSVRVGAPPATVAAQLTDLRRWASWAANETDGAAELRFGGPPAGVGASLYWSGADDAGRATVVAATGGAVELELEAERPRRATADVALRLAPDGGRTVVTAEVLAEQDLLQRAIAALTRSDGALGRRVDEGLARLRSLAEADEQVERYRVERSARIEASPALVRARLADLTAWPSWSPWEEHDLRARRSWGGPPVGAGASYYWSNAAAAAQGRVTILASSAERLELELEVPERAGAPSDVELALAPEGAGTRVTWVVTGEVDRRMVKPGELDRAAAPAAADPARAIASEVERALAGLKRVVESNPAVPSQRSL